ncbi:MAG: hypothetical protein AB7O04_10260 [Hyphomonadaceae bacterium]
MSEAIIIEAPVAIGGEDAGAAMVRLAGGTREGRLGPEPFMALTLALPSGLVTVAMDEATFGVFEKHWGVAKANAWRAVQQAAAVERPHFGQRKPSLVNAETPDDAA